MHKYYILSLRHTSPKDEWLTFERDNHAGYAWYKEWAGLFEKESVLPLIFEGESVYVREDILENFWRPVYYEKTIRYVVINNHEARSLFKIHRSQLSQKHPTNLGTWQLIDKSFVKQNIEFMNELYDIPKEHLR